MKEPGDKFLKFIKIIAWFFPIILASYLTLKSVRLGTDISGQTNPGYRFVRGFDFLIVLLSIILLISSYALASIHLEETFNVGHDLASFLALLFPYTHGVLLTVILYSMLLFLTLYDRYREWVIVYLNKLFLHKK